MIDEIALLEMANPIQQQQQQQSIDHTNEALHMTMYFIIIIIFLFQIKTNDSTILRFILVFFFVQFIIILGRDEG